jgi:FkbM family methyltransferase
MGPLALFFFRFSTDASPFKTQAAITILDPTDLLPIVQCDSVKDTSPLVESSFVHRVTSEIRSRFGDFQSAEEPLSLWLSQFRPTDDYTSEVLETFKMQLSVGLLCSRLYSRPPPTLDSFVRDFRQNLYPGYRAKYHGLDPDLPEVFYFHHGLKRLSPAVTAGLKQKDFLDIGACDGDSALVLAPYAGRVHSIEISKENIDTLHKTIAANPEITANVRVYHMGIGETVGSAGATGGGRAAQIMQGSEIEILPVDVFAARYNLTIGFLKADIEGYALAMVRGARQTMVRDRPIFSISCYHTFHEMYDVSMFLYNLLPGYRFEWHMENDRDFAFFELSLFGCPKELLNT